MSDYSAWVDVHRTLFGMATPDDVNLFKLWRERLSRFTFDELKQASFAIAEDTSDRARFRVNHLSMLTAHVKARRAEAEARERQREESQFASIECELCAGGGMVVVPRVEAIVDGAWSGIAMDVACTCRVGVSRFNAINGYLSSLETGQRMIDLNEYDAIIPDWRELMHAKAESDDRDFSVTELARKADLASPIPELEQRKDPSR